MERLLWGIGAEDVRVLGIRGSRALDFIAARSGDGIFLCEVPRVGVGVGVVFGEALDSAMTVLPSDVGEGVVDVIGKGCCCVSEVIVNPSS